MCRKALKIISLTLALTLAMSFAAAASVEFPFELGFDTDELTELCYTGRSASAVKYREGVIVLPETSFTVIDHGARSMGYDISQLSATISLKYERGDDHETFVETLRTYAQGSLSAGEYYPILSDNIIANLSERDLLYSDALKSLFITLRCPGRGGRTSAVTYLYVADDDDFYDYLDEFINEE